MFQNPIKSVAHLNNWIFLQPKLYYSIYLCKFEGKLYMCIIALFMCVLLSLRYDPSAPQARKNFVRHTQMKINNIYGQNAP